MKYKDLRDFIAQLEKKGELKRIRDEFLEEFLPIAIKNRDDYLKRHSGGANFDGQQI